MADPTTWGGVVVRCNLNEEGQVPRSASSNSPDIIMGGTKPLTDPSVLTKPENYNNAYSNQLFIGQPNYLYVRGKNFTQGEISGNWTLYWATPNILLLPYLWEKNALATATGNKKPPFALAADAIGASEDAFNWTPPPTTQGHYCMVAVAESPGFPNPVEGMNNIYSLAETMSTNANIAQRNVQMIVGNVPDFQSMAGYNQGSEGSKIDLAVRVKNLPKGSSYTVGSSTLLNGKTLYHEASDTKDNDFSYKWIDLDVPAQWSTMFTYTFNFGSDWSGIPPGEHPEITIQGELLQDPEDRLYHLGQVADPHPVTKELRLSASGGPVRYIPVGSVRTICPDVQPK